MAALTHPVIISVLLASAVLLVYACCLGVLCMRNAAARLHYLGPATLFPPFFVAAAVLTQEGLTQAGFKAVLIALLLALQGPVLAHVIGRAVALRDRKVYREKLHR